MHNPKGRHDSQRRRLLKFGAAAGILSAVPASDLLARQPSNAHIVIIGAGAAGLDIASRLQRSLEGARITLVGARQQHYYQPGFTLVASGLWQMDRVLTSTQEWVPQNVSWIEADATGFNPDNN